MDKITDDDEIVKLLDVKDIEFIEASELNETNENDRNSQNTENSKLSCETNGIVNGIVVACTERRSDEPTELSFEKGKHQQ